MSWQQDKRWSDRFLPEIKQILGLHLIGEPPIEEDAERNTDLMVLKMEAVRIGCRIRKHDYYQRYGHEFTIRAGRPSGTKTELAKIIEGWGQYFFYGFADPSETRLHSWMLADMNVFRSWYNRCLFDGKHPGKKNNNTDGSSYFLAFKINDLTGDFVVARSTHNVKAA